MIVRRQCFVMAWHFLSNSQSRHVLQSLTNLIADNKFQSLFSPFNDTLICKTSSLFSSRSQAPTPIGSNSTARSSRGLLSRTAASNICPYLKNWVVLVALCKVPFEKYFVHIANEGDDDIHWNVENRAVKGLYFIFRMTFDIHYHYERLQHPLTLWLWFGCLSTYESHFIHVLSSIFTPHTRSAALSFDASVLSWPKSKKTHLLVISLAVHLNLFAHCR